MGSIVRYARPRPLIRHPLTTNALERESGEARRSLFILVGSFFVTAMVMCAAVVATASSTWTDVIVMSAFVLVFALLKIVLANALIYTMLRYDAATPEVPLPASPIRSYRRLPLRQVPTKVRAKDQRRTGKLSAAAHLTVPN